VRNQWLIILSTESTDRHRKIEEPPRTTTPYARQKLRYHSNFRTKIPPSVLSVTDETRVVKKLCAVKGVDIQRVRFPPGDGSLQPVAIREAEEVTISSKPLM
jgi:hypothetical protein